jgi:hypothetical protein
MAHLDFEPPVDRYSPPDQLPIFGHQALHQEHEEHEPQAKNGEQSEDVEVGQGRRLLLIEIVKRLKGHRIAPSRLPGCKLHITNAFAACSGVDWDRIHVLQPSVFPSVIPCELGHFLRSLRSRNPIKQGISSPNFSADQYSQIPRIARNCRARLYRTRGRSDCGSL